MRVIHVVGARPNFMKIAPIMEEMAKYPEQFQQVLVHTGQHYDDNMSRVFFEDLGIPKPNLYLGVGSDSHAEQTARIMVEFEKVVSGERPDLAVVVGDVNSTMACAIVAAKLWVPVIAKPNSNCHHITKEFKKRHPCSCQRIEPVNCQSCSNQ